MNYNYKEILNKINTGESPALKKSIDEFCEGGFNFGDRELFNFDDLTEKEKLTWLEENREHLGLLY